MEPNDSCRHEDKRLCRRTLSNGVLTFVLQCRECGSQVRSVKKADVAGLMTEMGAEWPLPEFDAALREGYWAERQRLWRENYDARREDEQAEWRSRYDAHIQSEKWRLVRRKVLARAKGLCEGCGERQPAHVHHLSYARLGDEMLFDLVALCLPCHQKMHPDREVG